MTETQTVDLAAWLTRIWDEEERLAKDAALMSGWDGFGESRIVSGSEWVASYHIVKRKRAEGQPLESRKGRELADCGNLNLERAKHIAYHDPASVLARIAADRKILERIQRITGIHRDGSGSLGELSMVVEAKLMLHDLASPYKGHEGWQEAWDE